MLAAKGMTLPDRRTFKLAKSRLHNVPLALDRRGVTMKVGRGNATRRGLARVLCQNVRWTNLSRRDLRQSQ
jgi:hypothetical protein